LGEGICEDRVDSDYWVDEAAEKVAERRWQRGGTIFIHSVRPVPRDHMPYGEECSRVQLAVNRHLEEPAVKSGILNNRTRNNSCVYLLLWAKWHTAKIQCRVRIRCKGSWMEERRDGQGSNKGATREHRRDLLQVPATNPWLIGAKHDGGQWEVAEKLSLVLVIEFLS
jgi:hypothetical protein